ncbi:MAG: Lrp/AsnC family transcriptional regulator, partial [Candidatus Bathyarchaeia archaeon]
MSIRLDKVDAGILKFLQRDGRMMYKDLARQLGVSLPTIRTRIKRLRELGVIQKFTVVVNPDRIFGKTRAVFVIE